MTQNLLQDEKVLLSFLSREKSQTEDPVESRPCVEVTRVKSLGWGGGGTEDLEVLLLGVKKGTLTPKMDL